MLQIRSWSEGLNRVLETAAGPGDHDVTDTVRFIHTSQSDVA